MSDHTDAHDPRYDLDGGQWEALQALMGDPSNIGDDLAIACNVTSDDHVHARRVGATGSRFEGRVALAMHSSAGAVFVYVAAPQARRLAAHLLTAADELDGLTPLVFHKPRIADEAETPLAEAPEPKSPGLVGLVTAVPLAIIRKFLT